MLYFLFIGKQTRTESGDTKRYSQLLPFRRKEQLTSRDCEGICADTSSIQEMFVYSCREKLLGIEGGLNDWS